MLLTCLCLAALLGAALGAEAPAVTKPPWAGKTYRGTSKLAGGATIGQMTLRVAPNGRSLTFTIPWACGPFRQTSTHRVTIGRNGVFKGGRRNRNGSVQISFFLDGAFVGGRARVAKGDLQGAWRNFVIEDGEERVESDCETGNLSNPGIVWTVRRPGR